MAIADWLNAPVLGNATLGDFGGAAVDFYDTYQGNEASNDALDTIVQGYDQGINQVTEDANQTKGILGDVYDTNMANTQPYMDAGTTALDQYMGLMQDPSTIAQDPAYQWRYDTGLEARKRDLEAAGYADPMGSGARATGINDWASGFASQELDRALARDLPIIQTGQTGVGQGIMAGDSYSKGMSNVNQYSSQVLAGLYEGKADKQSTKALMDSMAMTSYLKGAEGLIQTMQNGQAPDLMSLIAGALGGGGPSTTSDGASLWDMLGEAFGFDPSDEGVVQTVSDFITGGGAGAGDGSGSGLEGLFGGGSLGDFAGVAGDTIGDIDWNSLFDFSDLGMENIFNSVGGDFSSLFSDIDLGAIGDIDWSNLFDFSSLGGTNGEGAMFGGGTGSDAFDLSSLDLGSFDVGGYSDSSWLNDAWDWGSSLFR